MTGWMVTSSVLIAIVLALRTALKGRISLRLQYALWLLVLVRLLVPVTPLGSALSVMNIMNSAPPAAVLVSGPASATTALPDADSPSGTAVRPAALESGPAAPHTPGEAKAAPHSVPKLTAGTVLRLVWLAGVLTVTAALLLSNLLFARRLRRMRRLFPAEAMKLPVYLAENLPSPCLFGLARPAIYLTPETAIPGARLGQILTHEETHFRHGDHWWSLLRGVALALHWYNPLVWLAAVISRRDAELCCDEDTIRRLGEEQRLEYGRTLLSMVALRRGPAGLLRCATTMTSGKRGLRERITLLARRPKTAAAPAVCLLLAVAVAAGCTFTGAKPSGSAAQSDEGGTSDLPEGYQLTATVPLKDVQTYTPGNQMTPEEAPVSDLAEIMPDGTGKDGTLTLPDGTEVLCYRDKSGNKYWALKRGETLTRFTREDNAYADGYSAEPYQGVFGHDGFRIICPRGAAYRAYDYYYLDADGLPQLLAECSNSVTEADFNGDGAKELLWHYHGSESYYCFERDGRLCLADVNGLLHDVLPDWIINSDAGQFDQEDALLPLLYRSSADGPEHKAFLRFTPEAIEVLERETAAEETAVYDCKDVKIGLPAKYADQLIVQTEFAPPDSGESFETPLIRVFEKASVEEGKADGMAEGLGWLFTISRMTRAQYERYICGELSGRMAFAASGPVDDGHYAAPVYDAYYVYSTATDVQFYRSGGEIDTRSDAWKNWEALNDMGSAVQADVIARNGLTAYRDNEFLDRDFTYDTAHAYMEYYPYFTFDGSKAEREALVLSQPARQGRGGIWCVERFYDEYGHLYPYLPSSGVSGGADGIAPGETAAEYYNRLQTECDSGKRNSDLLTPTGAAKLFAKTSGYYSGPPPASGSFAAVDGPDFAYMDLNGKAQQLALDLRTGRAVSDETLLSCAGRFTADTWGVLGRFEYDSDWWTPMKAALQKAASGDGQDLRDTKLLRLYLSYPKTEGVVAAGLKEILTAACQADPTIFSGTLNGTCTTPEQARVRAAVPGLQTE